MGANPGQYTNIITNDLPASATSTMLTLQIETTPIGIIYAKGNSANNDADNSGTPAVSFVPEIFKLPVTIDAQGNQMDLEPKGFGTLSSESPVTGIPHSLDSCRKSKRHAGPSQGQQIFRRKQRILLWRGKLHS